MSEPTSDVAAGSLGDATGRTPSEGARPAQVTLVTLTAMVIGSMVGAGVFSLPRALRHRDRGLRRPHRLG